MRLMLCCLLLAVLAGCQSDPAAPPVAPAASAPAPGRVQHAVIVTSQGEIEVELYPDKAPRTVANFLGLAKQGYYTGTIFHRVINDFMIQGGGFETDGRQKPSPLGTIPLEIDPALTHVDGAISMARPPGDPNTASSQFFICDGPQPNLNDAFLRQRGSQGYAVFGKVVRGIEVVRAIAALNKVNRGGAFTDLTAPIVVIKEVRVSE